MKMRYYIGLAAGVLAIIYFAFFTPSDTPCCDDPEPAKLTHIETITATSDGTYGYGAFCRINHVNATDQFVVTFGGSNRDTTADTELAESSGHVGGFEGAGGYAYKVYTTDLEFTGEDGIFITSGGDAASVMVDDVYYHLTGAPEGWRVISYDAVTWEELNDVTVTRSDDEEGNDQMIAYVNGQFDLSSLYDADPTNNAPDVGEATHHHILDKDLDFVDHFVLEDEPHSNGTSLVFVDGVYYFLTSTAFFGDLMVMQYDEGWNYLGSKVLVEDAQWPQGTVYDETSNQFYVAYLKVNDGVSNTRLSVFDREWNMVDDIAVTNFTREALSNAGRPSVMLHDGKVYVSYDVSTSDPITHEENRDWQCLISVFDYR